MRALHRKDGGIFTRTRLPDEEQKLSVGLLVDESGSMGWGDRITHARKTAIVLYDFCTSLGILLPFMGILQIPRVLLCIPMLNLILWMPLTVTG